MKFFVFPCFLCSIIFLVGCAQVEPFVDARREAGTLVPAGSSTKENPVICYGIIGTPEEREALAQSVCDESNRQAVLKEKNYFDCKLLTPVKEIYQCQNKS